MIKELKPSNKKLEKRIRTKQRKIDEKIQKDIEKRREKGEKILKTSMNKKDVAIYSFKNKKLNLKSEEDIKLKTELENLNRLTLNNKYTEAKIKAVEQGTQLYFNKMLQDYQLVKDKIELYFSNRRERTRYKTDYRGQMVAYTQYVPFTSTGLAIALDISHSFLSEVVSGKWAGVPADVIAVLRLAVARCEDDLITNSITGDFNASASMFALKNLHNWKDKSEVEVNGEVTHTLTDAVNRLARAKEQKKHVFDADNVEDAEVL